MKTRQQKGFWIFLSDCKLLYTYTPSHEAKQYFSLKYIHRHSVWNLHYCLIFPCFQAKRTTLDGKSFHTKTIWETWRNVSFLAIFSHFCFNYTFWVISNHCETTTTFDVYSHKSKMRQSQWHIFATSLVSLSKGLRIPFCSTRISKVVSFAIMLASLA